MKNVMIFLWLFSMIACVRYKQNFDYYIISDHEYKPLTNNDSIPSPPPPPPLPSNLAWYSNLVLIFDTTDKVYLYQTECYQKEDQSRSIRFEEPSPSFIRLTPDHLLTFNSNYIREFLLDNSNYFMLDTNETQSTRLIYLVSVADTIKNKSFYEIRNMVKIHRRTHGAIFAITRLITEEENNVLSCKKSNTQYDPNDYLWSSNFLDGHTIPFSSRYDSLSERMGFEIHAKHIFRPKITVIEKLPAPR